jgi:hypothetical protein
MYEPDSDLLAGWLTVEQAARAYGLSERTIRRRIHAGDVRAGHLTVKGQREWRIEPPSTPTRPDVAPSPSDGPSVPPSAPGTALIAIADVDRLLAPILSERDRLLQQVDTLQTARLADALALGQVQGQLAAVQAELARAVSPPPVDNAPRRRRWWHR